MDENQLALNGVLKRLDNKEMVDFMWIASVRALPFLTKDFIKKASESGYLTIMFLSIEACRSFCMTRSFNDINNSIFNLDLVRNLAANLARFPIPEISPDRGIIPALEIALTLAINIGLNPDIEPANNPAHARDLNLARHLAYDLANDIQVFEHQRYLDLLLEDAVLLKANRKDELNNDTAWYDESWEEWLKALNELGGYWGDWYVRLHKNHFRIMDEEEVKRNLTLPKEFWNKDTIISEKWLKKLTQPTVKYINEARVILLGEKGAGKTSLARRLINPEAPIPRIDESTEGVEVTHVKLSEMVQGITRDRDANVHIWDFAGHAITLAAHRVFLSERCLYIIVYDGRTEGRNRLSYWLDHVRNYGGRSRVIVLINLKDGHNPDIAENYFKERYGYNQCEFIRFSVKDDKTDLQRFREKLANIIADDPAWDQKVPENYHVIKEVIEKAFITEHRNHITRQEFDHIASTVEKVERDILLRSLTCLGICLWYPEVEGIDLLVLNPEWISRGIYRIINWLRESGRVDASISLAEFHQVFELYYYNDYPRDKHRFFYQLMQHYELAYKKVGCDEIVIPQCLPEDRPVRTDLPDFTQDTAFYVEIYSNKMGIDGQLISFPSDVLPRFIVRRSEDLKNSSVWRYGAVLEKDNVTALIEQDDFLIRLRLKGKERSDYLGELLFTLMEVLNSYPSFAIEKPEIRCSVEDNNGRSREMIPLNQIVNLVWYMERENKTLYYDPAREIEISLSNAKMYLSSKITDYLNSRESASITMERIDNLLKGSPVSNYSEFASHNIVASGESIKLFRLINNLKVAAKLEANEKDIKTIDETVVAIEEELKTNKPRKGFINSLLNGLKAIKGTAQLATAVSEIIRYVKD